MTDVIRSITLALTLLIPAIAAGQATSVEDRRSYDESELRLTSFAVPPPAPASEPEFRVLETPLEAASNTVSDPSPALTLPELEQLALESNPTLGGASARIQAAVGQQKQAGLCPNPMIGYMGSQMGDEGTAGMQGGYVSQEFVTGGKLRLDRAAASRDVRASQFRYDAQQMRVLNDVRIRFYEALVAQRRVELTEKLVGIGNAQVESSQRLLRGGQVSENTLLQAEIEADQTQIAQENARNDSQEVWRRLAAAVGMPTLQYTRLSGDLDESLPEHTWESAYSYLLERSPELNAARTLVERQQLLVKRARREPIPNVTVMAGAQHDNATRDEIANVQVSVPIPIWNANKGNIHKAQAELAAAQRNVERLELELQERLAAAFRRYANARQQTDKYRTRILPRAERSLGFVTEGYQSGQLDYLNLITSQRTYIQVNLAYLDSVRDLWETSIAIDGLLLRDSLSAAP